MLPLLIPPMPVVATITTGVLPMALSLALTPTQLLPFSGALMVRVALPLALTALDFAIRQPQYSFPSLHPMLQLTALHRYVLESVTLTISAAIFQLTA